MSPQTAQSCDDGVEGVEDDEEEDAGDGVEVAVVAEGAAEDVAALAVAVTGGGGDVRWRPAFFGTPVSIGEGAVEEEVEEAEDEAGEERAPWCMVPATPPTLTGLATSV